MMVETHDAFAGLVVHTSNGDVLSEERHQCRITVATDDDHIAIRVEQTVDIQSPADGMAAVRFYKGDSGDDFIAEMELDGVIRLGDTARVAVQS